MLMNLEILKNRKKELGLTNAALADLSGVSLGSINKIFSGQSCNPRVETLAAIERALGLERANAVYQTEETPAVLNDSAVKYKALKTVADMEALPEDYRAELIDGVIYDIGAPTYRHQRIVGYVFHKIYGYIDSHGGPCEVLISPLDVRLDMDDYTLVQPDLMIVCNPDRKTQKGIYGAPDWVMEVVSKESGYRDYILKASKYMKAGVREYWIVDADKNKVTVYSRKEDSFDACTYSLGEPVPVGIYDDLKIDLAWVLVGRSQNSWTNA